jgi:hypothetical protein
MKLLKAMRDREYAGLSREGASRRAQEVCAIAAETGQTMLACEHLTALTQKMNAEDAIDGQIAHERLAELASGSAKRVSGAELESRLTALLGD